MASLSALTPRSEDDNPTVTAVISHLVKPDQVSAYEKWLQDVSIVAQQFEGHYGVSFVRPQDKTYPEYAIILKFDRYQNLKRWMESPIRKRWLEKVQPLVQKDQDVQILTGFETWFTLPGKLIQQPPERYKMAALTALSVFTVSQRLSRTIGLLLANLPSLLRAFILTTLTVFSLVYVIMPRVTRLFYRWLYPHVKNGSSTQI